MSVTMVTLITLVTCVTCAAGELRHVPLNTRDLDKVLADDSGTRVIRLSDTCLLTSHGRPEDTRLEDTRLSGCTLRVSRNCSQPSCVKTKEELGIFCIQFLSKKGPLSRKKL